MKYESTILKRLIDTYGVVGNPRYISEIIKEFIVRGKECFPELFTYQADWLAHIDEFGLNPSYTVSYTGQSIYAPNTLERPVKSAILKGQTLVNLVSSYAFGGDSNLYEYRFYDRPVQSGETLTVFVVNPNISTIKVGIYSSITNLWVREQTFDVSINKKVVYTVPSNSLTKYVGVVVPNRNDSTGFENGLVIARGDQTHLEVNTYFEGMQSVKMPVLTTSNEDGTKTNILTVNEDVTLRGIGEIKDELNAVTGELTERIGEYQITGEENWDFLPEPRRLQIQNPKFIPNIKSGAFACDILEARQGNHGSLHGTVAVGTYYIGYTGDNWLRIILGEDLTSLEQGKEWLKANKPTIQYQLKTESIKTVDLSILDQNGQNVKQLMSFKGGTHFTTTSQDGSLLPTLTVDVVTDLEETLKMCSPDGNTL